MTADNDPSATPATRTTGDSYDLTIAAMAGPLWELALPFPPPPVGLDRRRGSDALRASCLRALQKAAACCTGAVVGVGLALLVGVLPGEAVRIIDLACVGLAGSCLGFVLARRTASANGAPRTRRPATLPDLTRRRRLRVRSFSVQDAVPSDWTRRN